MTAAAPHARAAARLLADKADLARHVTDAMYAERPELLERYGAAGRVRCGEDLLFTVEHLIPAVDLDDPKLFTGYVRWLDDLLRARNVATADVVRSLELIERASVERYPADEAAAIARHLRAGLAVLAEPAAR